MTYTIRQTRRAGRGVFATRGLPVGSLVMVDHTLRLPRVRKGCTLDSYVFCHGSDHLLVLGPISLVNHSRRPNCRVEFAESENGVLASLVVCRKVRAGEELRIDYGVPEWWARFAS